ncbi:MAG: VCBS repeat-containing protein, partial [Candidatus Thermoplasmatota archaeon]|nr:VCBS repeat-containing protein [Candidatus Thermoplasmatota archaeon]
MYGKMKLILVFFSPLLIMNLSYLYDDSSLDGATMDYEPEEEINEDEINSKNGVIFKNPEKVPARSRYTHYSLIVHDIDKNGYPDILYKTRIDGNVNQKDPALYFIQQNSSKEWVESKIDSNISMLLRGLININENDEMDLVYLEYDSNNESQVFYMFIDNNGTYLDQFFRASFNHEHYRYDSAPRIVDIDCDGDYDILTSSYRDHVYISVNPGNGDFSYGWDKDIPRSVGQRVYVPGGFAVHDINNDGWPDLCCPMGNGGSLNYPGSSQLYNWVSDGKGSWLDYSQGFPNGENGRVVSLGDIDNDGDLDYGLLTDKGAYIYENLNGNGWRKRSFPFKHTDITYFKFVDIDNDGFIDIVTLKYDIYNEEDLFINIVNISYGNGDFSWRNVNQFTHYGGRCRFMTLEDMDRDGDMDLLFEAFNTTDHYILYVPNEGVHHRDLIFTQLPHSPHLRSGSVHRLSWTMKNASDILGTDPVFNISFSFTGKNGSFQLYKDKKDVWWTEIKIPDIPTENMYIKIEWQGREYVAGPYVIHNSEDRTLLIDIDRPEMGSL